MDSSSDWTEVGTTSADLVKIIASLSEKIDVLIKRVDLLEARNREVLAHIQYQRGIQLEASTLPFDTDSRARAVNLALRKHIPIPLEKSRTKQ